MEIGKDVQSVAVAYAECSSNGHSLQQMWIVDSLAGLDNKQGAFCSKCGMSLFEVRGESDGS